ncbi:MAG: hypothetical protein FJ265_14890 [Planctomycetes bacterium]|nr:hypothetical protein [Planctomycetota bacterium]
MNRGSDDPPALRFLRWLLRSFHLGRWYGVEVRMYWAALLLPLLFLRWTMAAHVPFGLALALVAVQFTGLFTVIWTHEMGHVAMGWRHRIRSDLITLGPLGGLAHLNAPAPSPGAELRIALAGPCVHLLWFAVLWPLGLVVPAGAGFGGLPGWSVKFLWQLNLALLAFNLLPIFPLDGGRALRALLAMRWHPNRATLWVTTLGVAGGGLLVLLAMAPPFHLDLAAGVQGAIGLLIGLSCISGSLAERRAARHVPIYGHGAGRCEPWATDPDAWRRGASSPEPEARPGWFARWRAARSARRAAARAAAAKAFDEQVDAVLARVHEVGMAGLTAREKDVLKRAAARRRSAG